MPLTTVPDKAFDDVFTEQNWDTHIRDNINDFITRAALTPQKISEQILGTTVASVAFSGYLMTYRHLWIEYTARGDSAVNATDLLVRFNGDTGTNYERQTLHGAGATAGATEATSATSAALGHLTGSTAPSGAFAVGVIELPHYAATDQQKNALARSYYRGATGVGGRVVTHFGATWNAAVATQISSVTLLPGSGSFISGCLFTLYGLP